MRHPPSHRARAGTGLKRRGLDRARSGWRLKPARTYWYRYRHDGNGSRVGRTITAPLPNDPRTVNFAFVSVRMSMRARSTPIAG